MKTTVHVDPALKSVGENALNSWKQALSKHGVDLEIKYDKLQNGVDISILNADNVTTRLDNTEDTVGVSNDSDFEMKELAGLTVKTAGISIVDVDKDDKLVKDNSISEASLIRKAKYVVQINTEALKSDKEIEKVLKHELGHVFGLEHDNSDSLMTTYYNDPVFTGEISDNAAKKAAENIRSGKFCDCPTCAGKVKVSKQSHDIRRYLSPAKQVAVNYGE